MLKKLHTVLHLDEADNSSAMAPGKLAVPLRKMLMQDLTKLVLFSYIFLIFNSLTPIVADVLAHTFWEKEHLLTVHQFNGKYHVHFELMNSEKQNNGKAPCNLKSGTDDYVHLVLTGKYNFDSHNTLTAIFYKSYIYLFYPRLFMDIDYPPPRA